MLPRKFSLLSVTSSLLPVIPVSELEWLYLFPMHLSLRRSNQDMNAKETSFTVDLRIQTLEIQFEMLARDYTQKRVIYRTICRECPARGINLNSHCVRKGCRSAVVTLRFLVASIHFFWSHWYFSAANPLLCRHTFDIIRSANKFDINVLITHIYIYIVNEHSDDFYGNEINIEVKS